MKYTKGKIGRVFIVRFDHGEDFLGELKELAFKEKIDAATVNFMGALSKADMVTGPSELSLPPEPLKKSIDGGWEVVGFGTILKSKSGYDVHFHSSLGRDSETVTGCLRSGHEIFITIEAVVMELTDCTIKREQNDLTGMRLFSFGDEVPEAADK